MVGKTVFQFASMAKKYSKIDKALAIRIKEYWGAMIKQAQTLDKDNDMEKIIKKAKAPIEHLFDNHEFCDIAWCYSKQATRDKKIYKPPPNRPFYDKVRDNQIYCQLCDSLKRFQTAEAMAESMHKNDTQLN